MTIKEFARFYHIIRILLIYGIDQALPVTPSTKKIRLTRKCLFWLQNKHQDRPLGERLRLALQELGPIWIKFGQMLSTRRDLFSPNLADQLALLQDSVEPFDGKIARKIIEDTFEQSIETWFTDFNETPLATASIAQIHTAKFADNQPLAGQAVVFKIIRPGIEKIIRTDIALMYSIASWIPRLSEQGRRLKAVEIVQEYEKTILNELDLRKEMANAKQLRTNFHHSEMLYIPAVYESFCRQNVMVMERIFAIPVTDIERLNANGTNMKLLAERGVQVFFTQVFRDSFFHADMHPGNIFVNPNHPQNPQYIGIDCGIVGKLNEHDKRYLAESFVAFFNRDYRRVALMHIESGWTPADTDLDKFEQAFREVCEPIFAKPLSEISFGHVLLNLFSVAREFNMEVQPQLVLLQKTLLYIEGLGRQIYPQLDLWQTAKPFLQNWLNEQISLQATLRQLQQQWPQFSKNFTQFPNILLEALQQQKQINYRLNEINQSLKNNLHRPSHSVIKFTALISVIMATFYYAQRLPLTFSLALLSAEILALLWLSYR